MHLSFAPGTELPPATEALLFRVAQEAVRNVRAHADARRLDVSVTTGDGRVTLEVADDGRGFTPAEAPAANAPEGHFGLRLLADLARDSGADFELVSAPGAGTRVRLEAPIS